MLLRSLLVAGISSKRLLLIPSLKILSFLSKPNRGFLLHVEKNPIIHGILKKTFYDQFCTGETGPETRRRVREIKDLGFKGVILTYARETVFDHKTNKADVQGVDDVTGSSSADLCPHLEEWRVGTLKTVDLIEEGDILAVKLTGAGPKVTQAFIEGLPPPQRFLDAIDEICAACKSRSIQVIIDAESQHFQKGITKVGLEMMRRFNRDNSAVVYNTYQAYLKKTPSLIAEHLEAASKDGFTLGLKLVRGAYLGSDDRSLIHDTKKDTDDAYNGIATGALRKQLGQFGKGGGKPFPSVNLFLASHNRESVIGANRLHQERVKNGLPTIPVGFGQLHGMSDEVSFSLLAEKDENQTSPDVYKCSTWGSMGNLGTAILDSLIGSTDEKASPLPVKRIIACVRSERSAGRLSARLSSSHIPLEISSGNNAQAIEQSDVVLLGVDPADVHETLEESGLAAALAGKLLISIVAGWTRDQIETLLAEASAQSSDDYSKTWVIRTLPNIAATVSQSITAIEKPDPKLPPEHLEFTDALFNRIGKTVHLAPSQMDAFTAVGGSTPAFFAVIVDALIDASVAVGMPRQEATATIVQSMLGTATLLQSGVHPGVLRDQGTSPEGCTIGGLMVLEELGVRGHLGRGLREAVTIARLMGKDPHVNDTRH
ncbi:pyrroline-5-carboxylate reductase [Annulohypoxylon truncatum]|uniref:pyrroline-5-carboxylate reductase n=1 Tax=Annulohypoxylon truncatum TaxID=327061 RepID=UPI00200753D5|nr:pyrroline-5-carboxylate reductase [Annulohypoxylon truncatum]KAI1206252.1 pyrroline-5-carboxylate reductase [Annulohypoxylon truncatum]